VLHVDLGEVFQEGFKRQETTQHTLRRSVVSIHEVHTSQAHLVVTKQCKVNAGDDGNGDVEPSARETVELLHL
jgi:hypothetical protein